MTPLRRQLMMMMMREYGLQTFPGQNVSRIITFPVRRFPDNLYNLYNILNNFSTTG